MQKNKFWDELKKHRSDITALGAFVVITIVAIFAGFMETPETTSSLTIATAALLGVKRPDFYRFKFGDFEIATILDGAGQFEDTHPRFGCNVEQDTVLNYAKQHGLPTAWYENGFTPAIVNTGKELVLFDTGFGSAKRENGLGQLRGILQSSGYAPEDIDIVAITHGHPDHILGLMENGQPAFPNARYVISQVEFDYWNKNENIPDFRTENRELFMKIVTPFAEKMTFVKGGDTIASGIEAVEAFGHSAGHMAFHIESNNNRILLIADTTNHYILSLQQPDWHFNVDDDKEMAAVTRKKILEMVSTENIPIIGHHMPFPSVGYVEKTSESYRWLPVAYHFNR